MSIVPVSQWSLLVQVEHDRSHGKRIRRRGIHRNVVIIMTTIDLRAHNRMIIDDQIY